LKPRHKQRAFTPHEVRQISVESLTDPKTIVRYIRGEPVRPVCALRISRALRALGFDDAVRSTAA